MEWERDMAERAWLKVHEALGAKAPDFEDTPFGGYLERHAEVNPDAIALRFMGATTDYAALNQAANNEPNYQLILKVNIHKLI